MGFQGSASAPQRRPDIVIEELDGEAIAYDPGSGAVHRFAEIALPVWNLCDGSRTPAEIAEALLEGSYSGNSEEALARVTEVISEFLEKELLVDRVIDRVVEDADFSGQTMRETDGSESAIESATEPPKTSRRELIAGGFGKAVLAAPVVSTFFALNSFAAASNPINPGYSPACGGGLANPGYSCTTNQDCCDLGGAANTQCEPARGVCCVKNNQGTCYRDEDCCDGGTCNGSNICIN